MKQVNSLSLFIFSFLTLIALNSCNKNENNLEKNSEITIYESKVESKYVDSRTVFLGGNTKKVAKIDYQNSLINNFKNSDIWRESIKDVKLNYDGITKTYLHSSEILIVTIPFLDNPGEVFNIYVQGQKFLITRLAEIEKENGLRTMEIKSNRNELYYSFDINSSNQMGNWKFEKNIPLKETFKDKANTIKPRLEQPAETPCADRPFDKCMSCFLIDVCGSDWKCMILCGAALYACVAGAALACGTL